MFSVMQSDLQIKAEVALYLSCFFLHTFCERQNYSVTFELNIMHVCQHSNHIHP